MGVTGIHPKAGLSTGDLEESHMKRALRASAAETYVLASAEKIGAASPYVICPLADVDGIVADACDPEKNARRLSKARAFGHPGLSPDATADTRKRTADASGHVHRPPARARPPTRRTRAKSWISRENAESSRALAKLARPLQ